MERYWRIPDPTALLWESWGTEYGLFNRNSGETHLLNELPAEILRRLSNAPTSDLALAEALAADCEIECTPQWRQKVGDILDNLHTLGLIEPVRP
jgi:PqqD family protein of HPr-rel-A system